MVLFGAVAAKNLLRWHRAKIWISLCRRCVSGVTTGKRALELTGKRNAPVNAMEAMPEMLSFTVINDQ